MSFYLSRVVSGGNYCGSQVASAIRRGLLKPPHNFPCADCGKAATQYDHRDYNAALAVDPVCCSCNIRRGKAIPKMWDRQELLKTCIRNCQFHIVPWAREFCLEQIKVRVAGIEEATGGSITRFELRPDIFGRAA